LQGHRGRLFEPVGAALTGQADQARTVGDQLQQLDVVGGEAARCPAAHLHDAHQLAADQHRHPEQGAAAPLRRNRAGHLVGGRLRTDHRRPGLGHPAGESPAGRDPEPAPELGGEPSDRRRDELTGRRVQRQDHRGVDLEQRPDAVEQLVEQVGAGPGGQRGVRDRSDTPQPFVVVHTPGVLHGSSMPTAAGIPVAVDHAPG
jgi:hypothetical protein